MNIVFATDLPKADVLVLPVEKDGLARVSYGSIDSAGQRLIAGAARGARFEGDAGAIVEATIAVGDDVARVLLLGVGSGSEADYEKMFRFSVGAPDDPDRQALRDQVAAYSALTLGPRPARTP